MPAVPEPPARRPRPPAAPPFEALVERHGPGLLRFCVARLGADRGEEAFQETLLSALRRYEDLRDPAAAKAWLFAIAQRRIVDAARSRDRAPTPTDAVEDHAAAHHDPQPRGDGAWRLVAALPPKQREAVGLRVLGELSHAEIATVMGTSEPAARRNVFEGLARLRERLGPGGAA